MSEGSEPIIFGIHSASDVEGRTQKSVNPCVNQFGRGPNDKQCSTCAHLVYHSGGLTLRCALNIRHRHRRFWPACEKFKQKI